MAWTADDLVAAVRRRAQLPDAAADGAITDPDILAMADDEIALRLVPLVRQARGDYWVTYEDQEIVVGTARYRVPWRAQASGLRDVSIVDSAGRERPVPQIGLAERGMSEAYGGSIETTRSYMEGPDVVLVPSPSASGYTLRLRYHRSHATLIPDAYSSTMTLVSGEMRVVPDPSVTPVEVPAHDIYYARPPFGPAVLDFVPDSIDIAEYPAYVVFVYSAGPASIGVVEGVPYYVSEAGYTSVIDLPRECWPLLVSALTSRVLEVIGDRDGAQMAYALYERESGNVASLLAPRIEGTSVKIIDRASPLRRGGRRR